MRVPKTWPNADLTPNAKVILDKRYLKKVDGEVVETPEDMFYRVATVVAEVDEMHGYGEDDIRKLTIQNDYLSGVHAKFIDFDERRGELWAS